MPKKIEQCVKKVMENKGLSESSAWAICTSAMDAITGGNYKPILTGDKSLIKSSIEKDTGFLTSPVVLARTGVQHYMGYELGDMDNFDEIIGVFRPPEEVFDQDSIDSFVNLVVTDDHPSDMVNVENIKDLQVGMVSGVHQEGDLLKGILTITDKDTIKKINQGKLEVSVGYVNDLKKESGNYNGERYDYVQRSIRANHLAIVDQGRCGNACRINMDNKYRGSKLGLKINGKLFEIEDKKLHDAIVKMKKNFDEEMQEKEKEKDEMEKKKDEMEKEKDEMEKEKDEMEKEKDEMKKEKDEMKKEKEKISASKDAYSKDAISKMVSERAELLMEARSILGDKMPDCSDCPIEIKKAVINHVMKDMDTNKKTNDYIDAAYDIALMRYQESKDSLNRFSGDFLNQKDSEITRDDARNKYMQKMGLNKEV